MSNPAPSGAKKRLDHEIESSYDPVKVEAGWDAWWDREGFFCPSVGEAKSASPQKKFVMIMPPPNVTGNLHIGHTLTAAIEDTLTRWHRMRGDVTLWVPGQIWEWKKQKGGNICRQTRKLAASVDWTREAFTLDEKLSRAVKEAFVRMFDDGLIYRGTRIVSWCPHLRTALSNVEVSTEEVRPRSKVKIPGFDKEVEVGVLVHFLYRVKGTDETLEVATTRIETMLGDTAVAVHPEDERYKGLFARKSPNEMKLGRCSRTGDIIEPMLTPQWFVDCKGMARRAVEAVRSGDLKILPQHHEKKWFEWLGKEQDWCVSRQLWWGHRIPAYRVTHPPPPPDGEEMWVVGRNLEQATQRAKEKTGAQTVSLEQDEDVLDTWFSSGLLPFSVFGWPEQTEELETFFPTSILETGSDILCMWVARMVMLSLHLTDRLPFETVFLHAMVRDKHGQKMEKSRGNVIDPLDVINGISLEGLLQKLAEGNLPAEEVERATDLMKKDFPKGIPACGADALRCGLLAYTKQDRNINLDIKQIVGYRKFCNKLWNATKFALMKFPDDFTPRGLDNLAGAPSLDWADRWILHRLSECCRAINAALREFRFFDAVQATFCFWRDELCDFYLELIKPVFQDPTPRAPSSSRRAACLEVLYCCLDRGLRLLHPAMPFVTEELYQRLPGSEWEQDSICTAEFPLEVPQWTEPRLDDEFALFSAVINRFRSLLVSLEIPKTDRPAGMISHKDPAFRAFLSRRASEISSLARAAGAGGQMGEVRVLSEVSGESTQTGGEEESTTGGGLWVSGSREELERYVKDVVSDQCTVFLDCYGMTNLDQTVAQIEKKIGDTETKLRRYEETQRKPDYKKKVEAARRQEDSEKITEYSEKLRELRGARENLHRFLASDSKSKPPESRKQRSCAIS
uniref:valine--tRNA ligase n=1 Tax=Chromera velia CCMP2878 TaxID=1169474 RepID=A0A0G4HI03_9ALVE|eukprot:Cvel_6889.t1-p1 / transcript=Cvel_6889.t1 / gene=Cvel_6889 / organism=Chromera_velia_CCMP2878 / gene_product=Probable valine--tRNA ligase, cytoplasmic, putative / transcript_product=Probable valine--tRNA ligase, cytoplasmic, putative / location=Cvel_scaffold348:52239-61109(+) / protein_length=907 / sequence_SO=supercontig / SO=protein_coding / is_pseudo=false